MQGWQARLPSIRRQPAPDSDKPKLGDSLEVSVPAAALDVMTEPSAPIRLSASKGLPTTGLVKFVGEPLLSRSCHGVGWSGGVCCRTWPVP